MNHIELDPGERSTIEIRSTAGLTRITVPTWWTIHDLTILRLTLEAAGYRQTQPEHPHCIAAYAPAPDTDVDLFTRGGGVGLPATERQ